MNLKKLVGEIFQENLLYEILQFDIEQNLDKYLSKFIHIYFDHLDAGQIRVTEIAFMADENTLYATNRRIIGQKAWIEIYDHSNHIDLMICRQDRSGKFSVTGPRINQTQSFRRKSYDLPTRPRSLTPEERLQAFAELCGQLEYHLVSKPKKAV